jgi:DNA-binding transcriptional LysR family regulator
MGSSEAVKEAILAGLGVSILSIFAIKREISQGLLTVVNVSAGWRGIFILSIRNNSL